MTAALVQDSYVLQDFIERHRRLFVFTGAGCSTDSGIPDYRDLQGGWKRPQPVTFQAFMGELSTRQRYWARSLVGWPRFGLAQPNATHHALAALEARGQLELLLTQNVDRLHQAAGSQAVIDLHGRLDVVRCMGCERRMPRTEFQGLLEQANPGWAELDAAQAPDGDADLDDVAFDRFVVPPCPVCGGVFQAGCGVLRRERAARARGARVCASAGGRCGAGGGLVADGVFGLSFRADRRAQWLADRRAQLRAHPCGRTAQSEGGTVVRAGLGVPACAGRPAAYARRQ